MSYKNLYQPGVKNPLQGRNKIQKKQPMRQNNRGNLLIVQWGQNKRNQIASQYERHTPVLMLIEIVPFMSRIGQIVWTVEASESHHELQESCDTMRFMNHRTESLRIAIQGAAVFRVMQGVRGESTTFSNFFLGWGLVTMKQIIIKYGLLFKSFSSTLGSADNFHLHASALFSPVVQRNLRITSANPHGQRHGKFGYRFPAVNCREFS